MATPDITPAQIAAALGVVVGLLVTNGLITNDTGKLVTGIASFALPALLLVADAFIRHGRAQVAAAKARPVRRRPQSRK